MRKSRLALSVTGKIWRYIRGLERDKVFTTRELLTFGNRSAIDNCIFRLIEEDEIHRLTRGVFVRKRSDGSVPYYSVEEIAEIKAAAFGRKMHSHPFKKAKEIAVRLNLVKPNQKWIGERPELETTWEISGPSSSFVCGNKRVYFKKTTRRKIQLGDSKTGQIMRALWYNGIDNSYALRPNDAQVIAFRGIWEQGRREIYSSSALIPAWLSDIICSENSKRYMPGREILVA